LPAADGAPQAPLRMTEPPGGPYQAGSRMDKTGIPYHEELRALFEPGEAHDFFAHKPRSLEGLCAELSRLAYYEGGDRGLDGFLGRAGLRLALPSYDDGNTQAFLADSPQLRALAFRGSDDLKAWQTNLKTRPVPWSGPGRVHQGFLEALEAAWAKLGRFLTAADPRPLLVTGHSLGGGLATLAASRLPQALLYSFGAPRAGDAAFCHDMDKRAERHRRYVCYRDPVCLLPPGLLGYRHCGTVYYIAKEGEVTALPPAHAHPDIHEMEDLLRRFLSVMRDPRKPKRNDLTDHSPINYVSALR
jgi:triacylglycerol lipase